MNSALVSRIWRKLIRRLASEPEWLIKKRAVDQEFDSANGVDTGGVTQLKNLGVPRDSLSESVPHIAVDPVEFASAVDSIDENLSELTFIDLGSGKGRALVLAGRYPFRRIVGVEFAAALVATARANIARICEGQDINRYEIVHCDAREYDFPSEPLLIFLYNPFGSSMMKEVAERLRASLRVAPREAVVLYLNPFFDEAWAEAGFVEVKRGMHFAIFKLSTNRNSR